MRGRAAAGEAGPAQGHEQAAEHAADRRSARSCSRPPRPARSTSTTRGARRPFRGTDRRGAAGREGPQGRRLCHPAAEHDAAAVARIADQPRHSPEAVRSEPQPRRTWRRQRHARDHQSSSRSCARRRPRCSAPRTSPTTRSTTRWRRPRDRPSASSIGLRPPFRRRSGGSGRTSSPSPSRRARHFQPTPADWNFYAEQIRKQRYALDSDAAEAVFRVQQGADGRRLLRRQPALRADVQGAEGLPDLERRHARVRGLRPGRQATGALL